MTNALVTLSIVSHGQGPLLARLLSDLDALDDGSFRIVVTLNIPEDESFLEPHVGKPGFQLIRNHSGKGFGANHNAAFRTALPTSAFAVLNPDLRLPKWPMPPLLKALRSRPGIGAVAPLVLSPAGQPEDSVRRFPTVARLARRVLLGERRADYQISAGCQTVDWAAGMFVVFDSHAFNQVRGFDEGYFMYFEDADICRRLRERNLSTVWVPGAEVVHDARRASHRDVRAMQWHLRSAWRFLVLKRLLRAPNGTLLRSP